MVGEHMMSGHTPISILLVEDNPGDARLVVEAFREGRLVNNLHHVKDGAEAMAFVRREGRYADAQTPDLILLDLNLPKVNGVEVLKQIKSTTGLHRIPILVLTTSQADADIRICYDHGANGYIVKPVEFDKFINAIRTLETFWLSVVRLPPREH